MVSERRSAQMQRSFSSPSNPFVRANSYLYVYTHTHQLALSPGVNTPHNDTSNDRGTWEQKVDC